MLKKKPIETYNKNLIAQRIQPLNTNLNENLVQLSIKHSLLSRDGITILSKDGFVLYKHNQRFEYDEYLSSERGYFPYSNITEYKSNATEKCYHVVVKIGEPYVVINNGNITTIVVKTDEKGAVIITEENISLEKSTKTVNREELDKLLSLTSIDERLLVLKENGSIFDSEIKVPTDEEIVAREKAELELEYKEELVPHYTTSNYGVNAKSKRYIKKLIDDLSIENVPEDTLIMPRNMIFVRYNGNNLSLVKTTVTFSKPGEYLIKKETLPIINHNLDEVKGQILKGKDEVILPALNPSLKNKLKAWKEYFILYREMLAQQELQQTIDVINLTQSSQGIMTDEDEQSAFQDTVEEVLTDFEEDDTLKPRKI